MQHKLLAIGAAMAVAGSVAAAPLASESFTNLTSTNSGTGVVSPTPGFTLPGAPDLDPAGQYNNSYEYGGPYFVIGNDDALDFPGATDNKFLIHDGDVDQFFRVFSNTAIANTSPNARIAFAFNITSVSATAADNTLDLWRILDIGRTGTASGIMAVTVRNGNIRLQSNGITTTDVAPVTNFTVGDWYVFVLDYQRGNNVAKSYVIKASGAGAGTKTTFANAAATATNNNDIATLSTGATFAAPTGSNAFQVRLDTISIFSSALTEAALETEVRTAFSLPSSVDDWTAY